MNDAFVDNLVTQRRAFGPGGGRGPFEPFGELIFPYVEMGAINSFDLFGDNELPVFLFYWLNRNRYRRALDCGANLGLHTILMARCGWDVIAFEPDPVHVEMLNNNIADNDITEVDVHQSAISLADSRAEFIRVCGNTTGSHLAGAKANPYGKLERFEVDTEDIRDYLSWADIAKIDIEGHEADLLTGVPLKTWLTTDAFVEIGTEENARRIFSHLCLSGINMFSPKIGWSAAQSYEELPHSCQEGLMFISAKSEMPWQ